MVSGPAPTRKLSLAGTRLTAYPECLQAFGNRAKEVKFRALNYAIRSIHISKWKEHGLITTWLVLLLLPAAPSLSADLIQLTNQWTIPLGSHIDSSPAIGSKGTIYVGAFDGKFYALNSNGSTQWVFRAGLEIRSSAAISADGTIYFGSRDRKLHALNESGKEKWALTTAGWVDSSPAVV